MDEAAKVRLADVLARREQAQEAAAAEQRARESAEAASKARRAAVERRWVRTKEEISAAVDAVNSEIVSAGMRLSWSEKPRGDDHAGLAQLFIKLDEEDYAKERQVVFNVSALGLVQPVTLIPHTGRRIADFKIDEVSQAHYEAVLVDFLEQCITTGENNSVRR